MADSDDILFGVEGGVATVILNRPQALNAFTLDMYRRFDPMLRGWADDPAVHAVVIRGAGGRAFCAGGDIRAIYEAGRGLSDDRGLTGARLGPADALYCGFATHFVAQDRIAALVAALARAAWREGDEHRQLERLLDDFAGDPGPAPLAARRAAIDRCFAGATVETILDSLAQVAAGGGPDAEWAAQT